MEKFSLFADPWWVNLLLLIPFLAYFFWKERLRLTKNILIIAAVFGIAFGFVEAAVVVYLRATMSLLLGYNAMLGDVVQLSEKLPTTKILGLLPQSLFTIEFFREAATLVMLASIAFLIVKTFWERWAIFLWTFAFWDIFYYAGLWLLIRWPSSWLNPDTLFLIPVPWTSQVWFPVLVSGLSILAVVLKVL